MTENEMTEKKTDVPPAAGPELAPRRFAALPESHRHRPRKLTFVVPRYHECSDRVCRERQLAVRTRMKELVETFGPDDVAEVDQEDRDARAAAGAPELWTYDPTDEDHPVVPLDDLAVLELDGGRRLVYVLVHVPGPPDMSGGMFR